MRDQKILDLAAPRLTGDRDEADHYFFDQSELLNFARAIEAAALERAAQVCDWLADNWNSTDGLRDKMVEAADRCADEIRALAAPVERGGE
jgi:hypothetical protein